MKPDYSLKHHNFKTEAGLHMRFPQPDKLFFAYGFLWFSKREMCIQSLVLTLKEKLRITQAQFYDLGIQVYKQYNHRQIV